MHQAVPNARAESVAHAHRARQPVLQDAVPSQHREQLARHDGAEAADRAVFHQRPFGVSAGVADEPRRAHTQDLGFLAAHHVRLASVPPAHAGDDRHVHGRPFHPGAQVVERRRGGHVGHLRPAAVRSDHAAQQQRLARPERPQPVDFARPAARRHLEHAAAVLQQVARRAVRLDGPGAAVGRAPIDRDEAALPVRHSGGTSGFAHRCRSRDRS